MVARYIFLFTDVNKKSPWLDIFRIGEKYHFSPSPLEIAVNFDNARLMKMLLKCDITRGFTKAFKESCLKCDMEKIEMFLHSDQWQIMHVQINDSEFINYVTEANNQKLSAMHLMKIIPSNHEGVIEPLFENIKYFSKSDIDEHFGTLALLNNQELTKAVTNHLDSEQKKVVGKDALSKCLCEKKLESARVLIMDRTIPLSTDDSWWSYNPFSYENSYGTEIDILILKRKNETGENIPDLHYAIDVRRFDLAHKLLEDTEYNADDDFILHSLKKDYYKECLDELWIHTTPKVFMKSDEKGDTALHILARKSSDVEILEKILEELRKSGNKRKDLLSQKNNRKENALLIAIHNGNIEAAKLLMDECSVIFDQSNALYECVQIQSLPLVDHILGNPEFQHLREKIDTENEESPIHLAVRKRNQDILKSLLHNDQSDAVYHKNKQGNTGLHLAIEMNSFNECNIIMDIMNKQRTQENIGYLLSLQNEDGMTPIFLAFNFMDKQQANMFFEINNPFHYNGIYQCTHDLMKHK